jgi:hypothetical protein
MYVHVFLEQNPLVTIARRPFRSPVSADATNIGQSSPIRTASVAHTAHQLAGSQNDSSTGGEAHFGASNDAAAVAKR